MIEARPDWVLSRQRAWGVPLTCFVRRRPRRHRRHPPRPGRQRPHHGGLRGRGRRRLVRGRRQGALPRQRPPARRVGEGHRHPRRLVRLRLHPRLRAARPPRRRLAGRPLPRGHRPAPRLVPLLAAAGLRHPRPRALRGGADPRLHARRERHEDVEVARATPSRPQDVIQQYGADILRLWVAQSDYTVDQRIGPEILKGTADSYRRLRNTLRFLLGALDGFDEAERVEPAAMPELERWVLHRLAELDEEVREGYARLRLPGRVPGAVPVRHRRPLGLLLRRPQGRALLRRGDQPAPPRRAHRARRPLPPPRHLARADAPLHHGGGLARPLPRRGLLGPPRRLPRDPARLARRRRSRRSGTASAAPAASSPARWRSSAATSASAPASRPPRSSTSPTSALRAALASIDFADLCITSDLTLSADPAPAGAFTLDDVPGVAVAPTLAEGEKCARCWKILPDVGTHAHPGVCARCDAALG